MTDFDAVPALTDLEVPEPAEGEVRVRVRAASVNGFDLAVAAGYTKDYMEHRFPLPQVRAAAPDGVDAVAHLAGDASVAALVREGGRFASTLLQSPEQVPAETVTVIPVIANPTPRDPCPVRGQPGQRRDHRGDPGDLLPRAAPGGAQRLYPRNPGQGRHNHRLIRESARDSPVRP